MRLPPGVGSQEFSRALHQFEKTVGKEWVFTRDEDVALYNDAYTPFAAEPSRQLLASAAVAPISVEQVQGIVRTANQYKVPLYPISTGRNLGYGGSSPTCPGCVIVDLKRMDRVLEINDREAYMVVEPGVNFIELYRRFEEGNHPFLVAAPEPGWGSPVGNALDHGVSLVAGDNFGMAKGLEVVLPDGEVIRTGMGALPTRRLWHNYPYGFGPSIDGLFTQSNLGIVTKMGFWLVRKPEMQTSFSVSSFRSEDLQPLIETVQLMRDQGLLYLSTGGSPIRGSPGGGRRDSAGPLAPHASGAMTLLRKPDGGSDAEWDSLGRRHGVPVSMVSGSVRGPAKVVEATLDYARELFARVSGATFSRGASYRFPLDPQQIPPPERPGLGIPNLWIFTSVAMEATHGVYFFSPVCKATGEDLLAINETVRKVVLAHGSDEMQQHLLGWRMGVTVHAKAYVLAYDFPIFADADKDRRYREICERLMDACAAQGWGDYRAHCAFQTRVMRGYTFNDSALLRFHERVKDAVDPNGILAPGKSGIWPKHLRRQG